MGTETRLNRLGRALWELALAVLVAAAVAWLWPRVGVRLLGYEHYWFALGWLVLLGGPALFSQWEQTSDDDYPPQTLRPDALAWSSFAAAGLFLGLLLFGRHLGNYKLWLGVVYLGAISLRVAGLTLVLRGHLARRSRVSWLMALGAAALACLVGLLLLPWVSVDLVAHWPLPMSSLLHRLAGAVLWGGIAGAVLMLLPLWGMQMRSAWLAYLAVAMGPGPALAVSWFGPLPLVGVLALLLGAIAMQLARGRRPKLEQGPVSLYWLLRAIMLVWWGMGAAVALAAAWWQPNMGELFMQGLWLRALGAGAFVVICLGLLAEYSWPLAGRPKLLAVDEQRKVLGVMLSALALLFLLSPLLLMPTPPTAKASQELLERSRAELAGKTIVLGPDKPEVVLGAPVWVTNLNALFVVSMVRQGAQVKQGEPLAVINAEDDLNRPHIFTLRAGVDTADWALNRCDVATQARHGPARVARAWTVHTPTGETFLARSYLTGLYLGRDVNIIKKVSIRYLYKNPAGRPPVTLVIKRVFIY